MSRVRKVEDLFWYGRPTRECFEASEPNRPCRFGSKQALVLLCAQQFVPGMTSTPNRARHMAYRATQHTITCTFLPIQTRRRHGARHRQNRRHEAHRFTPCSTRLNFPNQSSSPVNTSKSVSLCFSLSAISSVQLFLCICRFQRLCFSFFILTFMLRASWYFNIQRLCASLRPGDWCYRACVMKPSQPQVYLLSPVARGMC